MLKKIYNWFVYSSANPQNIALTLRAGIPLLVILGLDSVWLEDIANNVVDLVVAIGALLTGVATIYGLSRKIVLSIV